MPKIVAPCLGCEDGVIEPNCHTSCERYLEYVRYKTTIKNNKNKVLNIDIYEGDLKMKMHQYKVKKEKKK